MKLKAILYLVAFAAFLGPFTQTIYTPLLPQVQLDLDTTHVLVNLSISVFTFVLAIMQIVYGPLTDRKGRRAVLLPGIVLYVIGSVGCAFSTSIYMLLTFRALQAAGIATGSVVATTVIGDLFSGKERGRAMGTFQMLVALGAVVGPLVGGLVGSQTDFHTVFFVLAATGLLMFLLNWRMLPETKPDVPRPPFRLGDFGKVLTQPIGAAVVVLGFVQYYTFYHFLVFLPDILGLNYSLDAGQLSLVYLPMTLLLVAGSSIGGRLQEKVSREKSLIATSTCNVLAVVLFLLLAKVSLPLLIVSIALFGLTLGLSLPVQTTLLTDAFLSNRATAIGVYNFARYIGMAMGPLVGSLFVLHGIGVLFGAAALLFACAVLFARNRLRKGK